MTQFPAENIMLPGNSFWIYTTLALKPIFRTIPISVRKAASSTLIASMRVSGIAHPLRIQILFPLQKTAKAGFKTALNTLKIQGHSERLFESGFLWYTCLRCLLAERMNFFKANPL